jgi:hypothetical protein
MADTVLSGTVRVPTDPLVLTAGAERNSSVTLL